MGAKITIDSATMMNKGLELIEAAWLFGIKAADIDILVHRQSIVHSLVEYVDNSVIAQLGLPDMRIPIQYALTFPARLALEAPSFDFLANPNLTFRAVDRVKYPALDMAYHCLREGGTAGCIFNAANEVAVAAFLSRQIGYTDIYKTIAHAFDTMPLISRPTLDDYAEVNCEARRVAETFIQKIQK